MLKFLKKEYAIINTKHDYLVRITENKTETLKKNEIIISWKEYIKIMKHNFFA